MPTSRSENFTRGAALLVSAGNICVSPHHLSDCLKNASPDQVELSKRCHIYAIGIRPSLAFVPDSLVISPTHTTGLVEISNAGSRRTVGFRLEGKPNCHSLKIDDYPHRIVRALDQAGNTLWGFPVNKLLMYADCEDSSLLDLEIVYVGQAFGKGNRSAFDRLKSHETLQRILADLTGNLPSHEVELLLFEYELGSRILIVNGAAGTPSDSEDKNIEKLFSGNIPARQQIALAEAGLIRYFEPRYNEIYKTNFPTEDMKILEACYDIGFSALIVEIDTTDFQFSIFSEKRSRGRHHIAQFDLHDPQKRRSFFSMIDKDGNECLLNKSGPIF